jgi:hypothetical protein
MRAPQRRVGGLRGRLAAPLGCGLLGALLFTPALSSGRLADDFVLLRTVRRVTGVLWPFSHNDLGQSAGASHFYRPLWVLWNAAVYQLSHSPVLAHALNLAGFAVICVEVVVLFERVGDRRAALLGGVAFAVFPSHGESVAWISGNTDLLAVALGLGGLVIALGEPITLPREACVVALTAAALLAKEIAAVFPLLAVLMFWARAGGAGGFRGRVRWRSVLLILGGVGIGLVARGLVIHGLGGYVSSPLTFKRAVGGLGSFVLGGFSAPQLRLLAHPLLWLVPVGLIGLIAAATIRARRVGEHDAGRMAIAGCAWFVLAIIPVVNQPLNLNTRNGDRLLLLPSIGVALAVGALLSRARPRSALGLGAPLAILCAIACLLNAGQWRAAGTESRRLLGEIDRLAPRNAEVIVLSVPAAYRGVHLYPDALDTAVQESGRPDLALSACVPVDVLTLSPDQISFRLTAAGLWLGRATPRVPFDVPVLGAGATQVSNGCVFGHGTGPSSTLGTALTAVVKPLPLPGRPSVTIYFDGRDMRPAPG